MASGRHDHSAGKGKGPLRIIINMFRLKYDSLSLFPVSIREKC